MNLDVANPNGIVPIFEPDDGATVIEPPGDGPGYWAGGASALYDDKERAFYLYYRLRRPIGKGRGWRCVVARSEDGIRFSTIWTCAKNELNAESIESAALIKTPDSNFRLYVSYVDLEDLSWKIALLEADSPEKFNPHHAKVVLQGEDADAYGVKDPYVGIVDGRYYMFVHYAARSLFDADPTDDELRGSGIFVSETGRGSAGLAVSDDGTKFTWQGDVLQPGEHWDSRLVRVDTVVHRPPLFMLFYSGRSTFEETYEDKTGVAVSLDLKQFHKLSTEVPLLASPHSTGALRYLDAVLVGEEIFFYYEYARDDGSHELRLSRITRI